MNSEYANLNSYDSIQVHGGSGYMLEYACQLMLRDATKAPELFEKSMKVYLNMAEAEVAKHYNFVKSLDVAAMESYRKA